jgi:hypothetical protein
MSKQGRLHALIVVRRADARLAALAHNKAVGDVVQLAGTARKLCDAMTSIQGARTRSTGAALAATGEFVGRLQVARTMTEQRIVEAHDRCDVAAADRRASRKALDQVTTLVASDRKCRQLKRDATLPSWRGVPLK